MGGGRRIFVGRQPILDPRRRTRGYELLYRSSEEAQTAVFPDTQTACLRTLRSVFVDMGLESIVGPHPAFLNVAPEVIRSDVVEALPTDRVVLEILETDVPDPALRARCRQLRKRGFSLALDDYVPGDPRGPLLPDVDYVKVDLVGTPVRQLRPLVHGLRSHSVKLLAEKVETAEEFELCSKAGFELFQGFFFARPRTLSGSSIDPARAAILQLLTQLGDEADLDQVEETLKHHVSLGVNLLRLVNSVALARREKIATVRQALVLVGQRELRRWLTLLLYAGDDVHGVASPLLETAAVRGRLMEILARRLAGASATRALEERAFLAGMLSLVDALLDTPLGNVLEQIHVEEEISSALLEHEGTLGQLLDLAERVERGDFDSVAKALGEHGLDPEELLRAETDAYRWVSAVEPDAAD